MFRKMTTTLAAAAIALTSLSAAPAQADSDDAARALAALLGIVVIGKIIRDNRDNDSDIVTRRHPADPVYRPHRRPVEPRPLPRRAHRKLLPQECLRSFDTYEGRVRMFGRKCLQKRYDRADRLPRQCARRVETYRGMRVGYEARCLRRNGYRLARG